MFQKVLMVCVGNICRSPLAEALWRERLASRGVKVTSAGLAALVGREADPTAVDVGKAHALDLSGHRARQLTPELVRAAELILVMEEGHVREVERMASMARGRVHRIGRFGSFDIPDPYRRPRPAFEEAYGLIARGLADFERAFFS